MKQNIKVSIIIPCYNSERFIERTIYSVLKQSVSELEIIVVNDGSTDSSRDLIERIIDPRIRLINTENNGVSKARNIGLQESRGKYILFLDSDDLIQRDYLKNAMEKLESDIYDFCTFPITYINEKDKFIEMKSTLRGTYENIQFEIATFSKNISACPSAYVYKRKSLLNHGLCFNEKLQSPEDRYFLLEVGRYLKGCLIKNGILMYRVTASSLSNNKNINLIKMQEAYLNQVIENNLIQSNDVRNVFIRKMSYQLFIDYLKKFNIRSIVYLYRNFKTRF
ncbi:MAG: glycosyltransferase family 2 protein [Brumimicrobium sp.]